MNLADRKILAVCASWEDVENLNLMLNRLIPSLSEGTRTVILTVGLAAVAAVLFPVKDDDTSAKGEGKEETA